MGSGLRNNQNLIEGVDKFRVNFPNLRLIAKKKES